MNNAAKTVVFFRPDHSHGIAFALAMAAQTRHLDVSYLGSSPNGWPDPSQCINQHIVIEHYLPTLSYLKTLALHATSVVLYPEASMFGHSYPVLPENVVCRVDNKPAFLRAALWQNDTEPEWMNELYSQGSQRNAINLWLWSEAHSKSEFLADTFHAMNVHLANGVAQEESETLGVYARTIISEQRQYREDIRLCGVTGYAVNLPHHMLRYAAYYLMNTNLLFVYTLRRSIVSGYIRTTPDLTEAIVSELKDVYSIHVTASSDELIYFRTSAARMSRLFSKGRADIRPIDTY